MTHIDEEGRRVRTDNLCRLLGYDPFLKRSWHDDVMEDIAEKVLELKQRVDEMENKE